jgi:uncharacterized protein (TIGR03086 family)
MDLIDTLERAWAQGRELMSGLTTADLAAPTPCPDWDLAALINHLLGEAQMMSDVNRGATDTSVHGDLVAPGDLIHSWECVAKDNVASWRESGLDGTRTYFYGTFPAAASIVINLGEVLLHSWDIAQAARLGFAIDPELAAPVYDLYCSVPLEGMRAGGQLGAEIPVPADAALADRLLGLLGRQP